MVLIDPFLSGSLYILLSLLSVYLNLPCLCLHNWHFCFPQTQNHPVFPHFCRLPSPLFPVDTHTCFFAFFGAEILSELYLTFNIYIQWIFSLQKNSEKDPSAVYHLDQQKLHIFFGFQCQLSSLLSHWMSSSLLEAKQCLLTHWCV